MERPGTGSRMSSVGIARPTTATRLQSGMRPASGVRPGTGRLSTASGMAGVGTVGLLCFFELSTLIFLCTALIKLEQAQLSQKQAIFQFNLEKK